MAAEGVQPRLIAHAVTGSGMIGMPTCFTMLPLLVAAAPPPPGAGAGGGYQGSAGHWSGCAAGCRGRQHDLCCWAPQGAGSTVPAPAVQPSQR
jgi:hypothetical protein